VRRAVGPHGARPKNAVSGGIMKYDGLPDAKARADLIEHVAMVK
jgi:cytochrome c2